MVFFKLGKRGIYSKTIKLILFLWYLQISKATLKQMCRTFFPPKNYPMDFEIPENVRNMFSFICILLVRKCSPSVCGKEKYPQNVAQQGLYGWNEGLTHLS